MYKKIIRADGSVIILMPKKETKAVTFEVMYKIGSRQETAAINGISHFVEHLMFKGTHQRPNTTTISRELDSVGAEYNAFTGKEHTGYYITADSKHLILAMDMLSDMLHNSKFDKAEVNRERGVIIEEINMYEDNPLMYAEDLFENLLYQGTSLGRLIAGPRDNIRKVSRDTLYNYHKKYYYSGNMIIGLAGKFDEKKSLLLINKFFPLAKKQSRLKIQPVKKIKQASPQVNILNRNLEQVQLILGFRTIGKKDKKFLTNQLLANILGGAMSSRMFIQIRERKGLCYFIRANADGYEDIGSFSIHSGLNKEKIYEALSAIKTELNKIKTEGITTDELKKAKENIKGRLILNLEHTNTYLNFIVLQELLGKPIKDLDQLLKEIDKISLKQVNDLAKEIINWSQANLAIMGPFNNKTEFLKILNKK